MWHLIYLARPGVATWDLQMRRAGRYRARTARDRNLTTKIPPPP